MGRSKPKFIDQDQIPKRRRHKKDLDRIHSKILKAKKQLDNVEKNGDKNRQRRQAKICTRLLPKAAIGIYRNGAKGKDIQKETLESTFHRARLKADALELFNGDTPDFKYVEKISTCDETTKQSPNKNFVKNSLKFWTPGSDLEEQSPVLGAAVQKKNQKPHPVKKKSEENGFENFNFDKIRKQNIDESTYAAQKENVHKLLFQNDEKHPKTTNVTQVQLFNNNSMEESRVNENRIQEIHEDSKSMSKALNQYKELCKMVSVVSFEDFLQNQPDPLTTIIKKLRNTYSNSLRKQCLRERNALNTAKSSRLSVENQASTNSDTSKMLQTSISSIEYEVPKYNENRTISPSLLENIPEEDDNNHLIQSDNIEPYDSISCSLQNILETYDTNDFIIGNRKNDDNQYSKQSIEDIHQSTRAANFYFVSEKDSVQKHSNYINRPPKNKRHNKDHFYVDFPDNENLQGIDNAKHTGIYTFSSDSMLLAEKYSSKDYVNKKSLTNFSKKATNKYNARNIKRPVIFRQNNVTAINHFAQKNDEDLFQKKSYEEQIYEQFGININNKNVDNKRHVYDDSFRQQFMRKENERELETMKSLDLSVEHQACTYVDDSQMSPNSSSICKINREIPKHTENNTIVFPSIEDISQKKNKFHSMQSRNGTCYNSRNVASYNNITKESLGMQFLNASGNFPTPSILNTQFVNDRMKTFEPQVALMEIKDSQESLVEKFDVNLHPKKMDGRNGLCQSNNSLQTCEALYNINACARQLACKQEQVLPKIRERLSNSNNDQINNYLQDLSPCNCNMKSTKPSQQIKLHICESNDAIEEFFEKSPHNWDQNVLFDNVNVRAMPSSTLNLSRNIQINKKFGESTYKEISKASKANEKCTRIQDSLSNCNEQYIYLDSTRCQHKCNVSQTHHRHKGVGQTMIQSGISHEDRDSNIMDNSINLSNDDRLLLDQNHTAYTYPKIIDNQHRSVLLQNITQPIKYLAVNNNSDIQRIPVYINDQNVIEDDSLQVITLLKPNVQTEKVYFHKNYNLRRK